MKFGFSEIANLKGVSKNVYTANYSKALLKEALVDSKLPQDTEINYLWKVYGSNEALLITPDFISYVNEYKKVTLFYFDKISRVYFSPDTNFYLYDLNDSRCGIIPARFFGLESKYLITEENRDAIKNFFNRRISKGHFNYDIGEFYDIAIEEIEALGNFAEVEKLDQDIKEEFANKVISIYDDFIKKYGREEIYIYLEISYAFALSLKNENFEALQILDTIIDVSGDEDGLDSFYAFKAEILLKMGKDYESILYFKKAYELSADTQTKLEIKKNLNEVTEKFTENFLELPLQDRKLILIDDGFKSSPNNSFIVLDKSNLPKKIKFPNYPKSNELYVAHPYVKEVYLSFSTYDAILSADKFDEFFYFVQCLGAKKITYKIVKGNHINQNKRKKLNVDVDLSIGKAPLKSSGNFSFAKNNQNSSQQEISNARSKTQTFNPVKMPYIPSELIWYPHELTWHRLYQQRINGNILNHHEVISSKNSLSISESEKRNLKVAFKNFFVDAGVNIGQLVEENFSQDDSIEWEIEIEFESIENLKESNVVVNSEQNLLTDSVEEERDYLNEVQYMLEDDGIIDEKERKILERYREKKGISKERAEELEIMLKSLDDLNENEKEYLEEFQEILNDGEITEKERRILNRFADRLEISSERITQLEMLVN